MSLFCRFSHWYHRVTEGLFLSIRARVILSYLFIIGAGFLFLTQKITHDVRPRYLEAEEEVMVDIANLLAALVEPSWDAGHPNIALLLSACDAARARSFTAPIYEMKKNSIDLHFYITDAAGRVLFDSDESRRVGADYSRFNDVYLTLRGEYGARSTPSTQGSLSSTVLYVAAPIHHNGEIAGVLTVTKPLASMEVFMHRAQRRILLLGTGAACAAVLFGIIFSAWLTYPIRNLTRYAHAIRDGRKRPPRPHLGHSEMRTLGLAFEGMRDALEGKDYVNRYVQTLTHEMKSPVAAIQGAAELLQEEMPASDRQRFLFNIRTESARLQNVVDNLLLLAAVEAKKKLDRRDPLSLTGILRHVASEASTRATLRGIRVHLETPPQATVMGDPFLIERTVHNLLENALAFTPEGGEITLALRRQEEQWQIIVADSGPGIPDYALERAKERFYSLPRPDTGRKSTGLGLAFATEVAHLHYGSLDLRNRPAGGAEAVFSLPAFS